MSIAHAEPRPLASIAVVAVAVLTLVGLELGVRAIYEAPTPLLDKARAYAELPVGPTRDVLLLGTCLPEQILDEDRVSRALPPDVRLVELASAATGPMDWALALRHHIPTDAPVSALILAYGKSDLTIEPDPWESEMMDLAALSDLPLLMEIGCQDTDCWAEMGLRKASRAYRYRGWLANRLWNTLGTRVPRPTRRVGDTAAPPTSAPTRDDLRPLQQVLAAATARNVPIYAWELPRREQLEGQVTPPANAQQVRALRDGAGAKPLVLGTMPLEPSHFTDDVHTTAAGTAVISDAFAAALLAALGA